MHPNILWICSDQQRWDTLGCYGNRLVQTPNLDRLAARGILFERCITQSPVCTPSRACFLTGRYARTTRCRQNGQALPPWEVTVPRLLRDAGYVCGLSGKLHTAPCHPSACPGMEQRIDDGYSVFHWSHHPAPDAKGCNWVGNEYTQWLHEHRRQWRSEPYEGSRYVQAGMPEEWHQTTWCTDKAISFIERAPTFGRPWLFSVNYFDPHHPFDPPRELLDQWRDRLDEIPLPNFVEGELDDKPVFQKMDHRGAYNRRAGFDWRAMSETDHKLVRAAYWAMCELIDRQVGRLLETLERTGQADNTIVVFTSDHGEMLGDHGIYLKGPYFYEPAVRVPLIMAGPGLASGARVSALVELGDLAPTLLEATGLEPSPGMQAKSFWRLLAEGLPAEPHHRDDAYCEYYNAMPWHTDPQAHATMVTTERWKLVVYHGVDQGELYDLAADPAETVNLWNHPEAADVKTTMLLRLADRMARTVDPLPLRQGPW